VDVKPDERVRALNTLVASQLLYPPRRVVAVFRRARESGPAVLVPLAWTLVGAAHVGLVAVRPLLVAHVVMVALLVAFVVLSWREMATGVLRAWRAVVLAGVPVTLAGTVGLLGASPDPTLLGVSLYGWMLLPAAGLAYTATREVTVAWPYAGGAAACLVGAAVHAAAPATVGPLGTVVGLALVGAGQTAGIVDAVVRY
jgi:hypothetical protein